MKNKLIATSLVVFIMIAQPIYGKDLVCSGKQFVYENGFDEPASEFNNEFVILLDKESKTISTHFLGSDLSSKYFERGTDLAGGFEMESEFLGREVKSMLFNIDRYSGQIVLTYQLSNDDLLFSFRGECKLKEKLF